ncbi:histidine--tRNA ligase [Candidatus Woesebacteria bacterium]|nr:histidine--tRNA ligase [Candidatus Woesebacteria bacterium]
MGSKAKTKKIQTLKGFRDFLPEEALQRKWLRDKIEEVFARWGYDPIETPTLESLELFEGQIGEDEKLFYQFEDPGGRKVALRYDQTVPAARVVSDNWQELPTPFKRYQIQMAYRAEKPQKGRYREFLQADADIYGVESPYADAETIALSLDIYRELGFKRYKALVNDRGLLKDIPYKALSSLDKLYKIGEKKVLTEMQEKGIKKADAEKYLNNMKGLKPSKMIEEIFEYLKKLGFSEEYFEFTPTIVRSFSYSTGPIWEIVVPESGLGSLLGGERYDKLTKDISGKSISATGFAIGFDRTLDAAVKEGLVPKFTTNSKVLVTIFSEKQLDLSFKVFNMLRQAKINCEIYPDPKAKLQKQLKYADKKNIPYAVIVGPDEILKDEVVLKDLNSKKQENIPLQSLLARIK